MELAEKLTAVDPWYWAKLNKIKLQGGYFSVDGFEYQAGVMQCKSRHKVIRKAAQMGFTEGEVLSTLHGLIHGRYKRGSLYLFPSETDVSDFSKARFNPLIQDNRSTIGSYVRHTNSVGIKRIGNAMLYLRGARATSRIEGVKSDSSRLRSIPVDKVTRDERDLMADLMVEMSKARMFQSDVREEVDLSTPSLPDYGIDTLYQESDQRRWLVPCSCGKWTCLGETFPDCIKFRDGVAYRSCQCGKELDPRLGEWVALYPDREIAGFWISQLANYRFPAIDIWKAYSEPRNDDLSEFYNSIMGLPYAAVENRLTPQSVYNLCSGEMMAVSSGQRTAMGVDVGKKLHHVIGYRKDRKNYEIIHVGEAESWEELHDIRKKFNVTSCVIDAGPEIHAPKVFQKAEPIRIFLCRYSDHMPGGPQWDAKEKIVKVNRTEWCDTVHSMVMNERISLPRRSPVIEQYVRQMTNTAKKLVTNVETGSSKYVYKKLSGGDDYFHATLYFLLACHRTAPVKSEHSPGARMPEYQDTTSYV